MRHISQHIFLAAIFLGLTWQVQDVLAQQGADHSAATAATRLITVGTRSGPRPTIERAQSSNLLMVNGTLYLVDAGIGTTRRLTEAGIRIADIGKIFRSLRTITLFYSARPSMVCAAAFHA